MIIFSKDKRIFNNEKSTVKNIKTSNLSSKSTESRNNKKLSINRLKITQHKSSKKMRTKNR